MREAFLALLRGGDPDQIVWTADISWWIDGQVQAGVGDPRWQTEQGHLDLCNQLGCMPYYWYGKFWAAEARFEGVEVVEQEDGSQRERLYRTPVGELRERFACVEGGWSEAPVEHAVKTAADLETLLWLMERRRLEPTNVADYPARARHWARHDGVPCLGLPRSPLPAFVTEWAGVENGALLLFDEPEKCAAVLALMEEQEQVIIDAVAEVAPAVVHFPDNLDSGNLTSFYDLYMDGPYRRRLQKLHAAGVACAVHMDGAVRGLLPLVAAAGFDAVEAITPQPAGDVTFQEVGNLLGESSAVRWGGVPGVMFAPPFDDASFMAHVQALVDDWQGSRFVVGVADQVPPNGDIRRVGRVSEFLLHHRRARHGRP